MEWMRILSRRSPVGKASSDSSDMPRHDTVVDRGNSGLSGLFGPELLTLSQRPISLREGRLTRSRAAGCGSESSGELSTVL